MIADLRRALPLLCIRPGGFALSVLFGALGLGSAIALSAVAAWLIARASQLPPVLSLTVAAVAVRTFGVSRPVLRYLERLSSHRVALDAMASLRVQLYRIISHGRFAQLSNLRRGDLQARVSSDVEEFANVIVLTLLPACVAAVVGVGVVVFLAFLSPAIALVVACCQLAAGIAGPYLTMRGARIAELGRQRAEVELTSEAFTALSSASELQVSGRLRDLMDQIEHHEDDLKRATDRAALPTALGLGFDTLALGAAVVGAIAIGIGAVSAGHLTEIELAVVVLTPLAAFEGIRALPAAFVQLVRSSRAASRILELLDDANGSPVLAPLGEDVDPRPGASRGSRHVTSPVTLSARGLGLAWPGGPLVAEGITIDAAPGTCLAVIGPSGVGKTTLLATLAGQIPAAAGTLSYDGDSPGEDPRVPLVAVTAEDAHIFHTSLLENLRVGNGDLTAPQARDLIERAGLADWLAGLPDGLDTVLGSDGQTVSGGERRRILLARALGSTAPILLMDESAEHLDGPTADRLITDLISTCRTEGRTLILVTHRLSPLSEADEVIMLGRQGETTRILDRGRHAHLADHHAHYRWLLDKERDNT